MVKDKLMNKKESVKDPTDNNNKSGFIDQMIKSLNLHLHDKISISFFIFCITLHILTQSIQNE